MRTVIGCRIKALLDNGDLLRDDRVLELTGQRLEVEFGKLSVLLGEFRRTLGQQELWMLG